MKKEKAGIPYFVLKGITFIIIFLILFMMISKVFMIKSENFYNYFNFNHQEKNSIDVLVMGSSHSMDGIEAREIDRILKEEYGKELKSFNMSVTGMRLEQIYYRLKEALKTQRPSLLVIETFSCAPQSTGTEENINRWSLDYLPLSLEKWKYIKSNVEEKLQTSFFIPFIKYHTRWRELTVEDWEVLSKEKTVEKSRYQGIEAPDKPDFKGEEDDYFDQDFTKYNQLKALPELYITYMNEIIAMCREIDCNILFLSIPYKIQADFYNVQLIEYNNFLQKEFVNEQDIFLYDMNREISSLNWGYKHMTDEGHVNNAGREIINQKLAEKAALILYKEEK